MKDAELMQQAAEWISDSISAHYEFGGDAPGENDGKRLCGELYQRAERFRVMGDGEGHTVAIFTDAESRLIRKVLSSEVPGPLSHRDAAAAFNRGIQRGTERIKAEFDAEQKVRKNR